MPACPDCGQKLGESDIIKQQGYEQPDPTFQFDTHHCSTCDTVAQFRGTGELEHKLPSKDAHDRYTDSGNKINVKIGETVVLPATVYDRIFEEPDKYDTGVTEYASVIFERAEDN